ncbi:MAG: hypothetical protein MUE41_17870, partial [Gemmatimonadaceae bacterium]|nr:hypothetical protein [Gemmatimonadaceae bacterium]
MAAVLLALVGVGILVTSSLGAIIPAARGVRMRWAATRAQLAATSAGADPRVLAAFPWLEPGDSNVVALPAASDVRATAARVALSVPFVGARVVAHAWGQGTPLDGMASGWALLRRRRST